MKNRAKALLDRCEALSLLCTKAAGHWSFIKMILNTPLIITSSVMCILNSMTTTDNGNQMRIPNVVVNGISVLILSIQSNLKASEKLELFKGLSLSYIKLAHQIEGIEEELLTRENLNTLQDKYDLFLSQTMFEEIPDKCKRQVMVLFQGRSVPLNLNGASGLVVEKKRLSSKGFDLSGEVV